MTVHWSRKQLIPEPSFVPAFAGQWGSDDSYWKETWGITRRLPFDELHAHRVAEGDITDTDTTVKQTDQV